MNGVGLYIHVPFCPKLCPYCGFYKMLGNRSLEVLFLENIKQECRYYSDQFGRIPIQTIFFGGGTPNALKITTIESIMSVIHSCFDTSELIEFSMEMNPGIHSIKKLREIVSQGVTRISVGVQSFDDQLLQLYGRNHTGSDARQFVLDCQSMGVHSVSVDLMFGHPNQPLLVIDQACEEISKLNVQHASIYGLTIEPNTPYYHQGMVVNDDHQGDQYRHIQQGLVDQGFDQYEVSNFSKPGFECRHNIKYWTFQPTIGLGAGSHSYIRGVRYSNLTDIQAYIDLVPHQLFKLNKSNNDVVDWNDYIGTRLRYKSPIFFEDVFQLCKIDVWKDVLAQCKDLITNGFLEVNDDSFCVTDTGFIVLDECLARLII